ncbi:hypothetical protein [Pseudonocardia broussonetiae]|uniref:Uncharacterized protein n=1 Tax=Pseudonocardia broussonetiae TaxID=2736640 RepID=A0A6M6JM35_9PSEU|nr:hypothetical protein [Pseudonocardia broussonetiae]QJY49028.1 hypothetical protein HOP40_27310 [Pseudonocardia broussonetiae]
MTVLVASGAVGALILAPSVVGVVIILLAYGLVIGIVAAAFAVQWINCSRR